MYKELYQYLVQHKELPIPGIGTFLIERQPAVVDFTNKRIEAPVYSVKLSQDSYIPGQFFFEWIAELLQVSIRDAVFRFNDFAFTFKQQLSDGAIVDWQGLGRLSRNERGEILLVPESFVQPKSLPADRIIRERAEHKVRVGEDEKSSDEMTALLKRDDIKKASWWILSTAIALLALMFIGWWLSEHGLTFSSFSQSQKLVPGETPVQQYKILP